MIIKFKLLIIDPDGIIYLCKMYLKIISFQKI